MSHFITLSEAETMTALYRAQKENILATAYQEQGILPICETFDKAELETVLAREGCEAVRVYYGMDEEYKVYAILVGVNEEDEDMLPPESPMLIDDYIMEKGNRCPDLCPPSSPLNS